VPFGCLFSLASVFYLYNFSEVAIEKVRNSCAIFKMSYFWGFAQTTN